MQLEMENFTKYFPAFFSFTEDRSFFFFLNDKFARRLLAFPVVQANVSVSARAQFLSNFGSRGRMENDKIFRIFKFCLENTEV